MASHDGKMMTAEPRDRLSTVADYRRFPCAPADTTVRIDAIRCNDFVPDLPRGESKIDGMTYTYFIQRASGGPIKIGKSQNIRGRLGTMQLGFPDPLVGIAYIEGDFEVYAHHRFLHLCIGGEWFQETPELLAFIKEHAIASDIRYPLETLERMRQRLMTRLESLEFRPGHHGYRKANVRPSWAI